MTSLADVALRARVPRPVKQVVKSGVESYGAATSRARLLPEYVILGGQRCGTTSLYQYLVEHPAIAAATTKEVHFFDVGYARGSSWYRGHFPTGAYLRALTRRTGMRATTGEASPYYLFHPRAPYRLADLLPWARLIVVLRDPVSRLASHYHHEVALGHERLPLADALAQEPERMQGEEARILQDPAYQSPAHQHHSYFSRGLYWDQLTRWFSVIPREQFLIVEYERFFSDPTAQLDRVLGFLGLPPQGRTSFEVYNSRAYNRGDLRIAAELYERYEPHNRRLYELLGDDLGWGPR